MKKAEFITHLLFPSRNLSWIMALVFGVSFLQQHQATGQDFLPLQAPARPADFKTQDTQGTKQIFTCKKGPWGELEYYYTYLEIPESMIDLIRVPSEQTIWRFMDMSLAEVKKYIQGSGLSQQGVDDLINRSIWFELDDEIRLHPKPAAVMAIPPQIRKKIYSVLGKWEENPYYRSPVILEGDNVREFFAGSGLPENVLSMVEQLTYTRGSEIAFSDVALVAARIAEEDVLNNFMNALTRTRTMMLRIHVTPESDLGKLSEYWTGGYRSSRSIPYLEAVHRSGKSHWIDVIQLFPPVPKRNLYTYPNLSSGLSGVFPNSYWTSLNFFEVSAKGEFQDIEVAKRTIRERYDPVDSVRQFGDVLILTDPKTNRWLHSCVYIADDIVFSKENGGVLKPWILAKLGDVQSRFGEKGAVKVEVWRRKKKSGS